MFQGCQVWYASRALRCASMEPSGRSCDSYCPKVSASLREGRGGVELGLEVEDELWWFENENLEQLNLGIDAYLGT